MTEKFVPITEVCRPDDQSRCTVNNVCKVAEQMPKTADLSLNHNNFLLLLGNMHYVGYLAGCPASELAAAYETARQNRRDRTAAKKIYQSYCAASRVKRNV